MGIEIVSPPYSARPGQTVSSNFANPVLAYAWGIWGFELSYNTDYDIQSLGISMNSNQSSATQVSVTIHLTLQDASGNQISAANSSLYPVCVAVTGSGASNTLLGNVTGVKNDESVPVTLPNVESGDRFATAFLSGVNFQYSSGNHGLRSSEVGCGLSYTGPQSTEGLITGDSSFVDNHSQPADIETLDAGWMASSYEGTLLGIEPVQQQTKSGFDVTMSQLASVGESVVLLTGWKIALDRPSHIMAVTVGGGIPSLKSGTKNVLTVPSLYASVTDSHGERQDNNLSFASALVVALPGD